MTYQTPYTNYRLPLKNGSLKNEVENVPPLLGKSVRKQMRPSTIPQANLLSPKGVISSFAGNSSPPRKKVANNPHAKHNTLPLRPPIPNNNEVASDNNVAVLLPNIACVMRPPSSHSQGNRFKEVTTIPTKAWIYFELLDIYQTWKCGPAKQLPFQHIRCRVMTDYC